MQTYSELYASPYKDDFIKLLKKFFRNYITEADMHELARLKLDDTEFLMQLRRIRQSTLPGREGTEHTMADVSEYRGSKRTNEILDILEISEYEIIVNEAASGGRYLDIGAHDGSITMEVSEEFGFSQDNVFALDVNPQGPMVDEFDGVNMYYGDKAFCFVSFYQVLHHVRDLALLNDVSRCTKPGGYLIIREHNKPNNDPQGGFNKLVELEHAIYDVVMLEEYDTYEDFIAQYYAKYHSKYEWSKILTSHGFKFIREQDVRTELPGLTKPGPRGSTQPVYRREPTRHYYALYRKVKKFRPRE